MTSIDNLMSGNAVTQEFDHHGRLADVLGEFSERSMQVPQTADWSVPFSTHDLALKTVQGFDLPERIWRAAKLTSTMRAPDGSNGCTVWSGGGFNTPDAECWTIGGDNLTEQGWNRGLCRVWHSQVQRTPLGNYQLRLQEFATFQSTELALEWLWNLKQARYAVWREEQAKERERMAGTEHQEERMESGIALLVGTAVDAKLKGTDPTSEYEGLDQDRTRPLTVIERRQARRNRALAARQLREQTTD